MSLLGKTRVKQAHTLCCKEGLLSWLSLVKLHDYDGSRLQGPNLRGGVEEEEEDASKHAR